MKKLVATLIITYNSDIRKLQQIISKLSFDSDVFIVDNSDNAAFSSSIAKLNTHCTLFNKSNLGIAAAQNIGLNEILKKSYQFVLLMDDDSFPPDNFINNLLFSYQELNNEHRNIAALCAKPIYCNSLNNQIIDMSNAKNINLKKYFPCDLLNSSGSLIPVSNFYNVGLFDESLFIDLVDFEWGYRAKYIGLDIYICRDIPFEHTLGNYSKKFGPFSISCGAPIRSYYQFRNSFLISKNSYIPLTYKLRMFFKLPVKLVCNLILFDSRLLRLKLSLIGCLHGFCGRGGKY
jgi:rhamnosyltransferase